MTSAVGTALLNNPVNKLLFSLQGCKTRLCIWM